MFEVLWRIVKWVIFLWCAWKVAEILYFATTCSEEDKEQIRVLWQKSPGLAQFVSRAAPIVAAGKHETGD